MISTITLLLGRQFVRPAVVQTRILSTGQWRSFPRFTKSEETPAAEPELDQWDEIEQEMFNKKNKKMINPKNVFKETDFDFAAMEKHVIKPHSGEMTKKTQFRKEKKLPEKKSEKLTDPESGLTFTRLDRDHPLLNQIMLAARSKKYSEDKQLLVLEGRRLIVDGIQAGLKLKSLVFSRIEQVKLIRDHLNDPDTEYYKVFNHNLKFWSELTTCPGIMGVFERPLDMSELLDKRFKPTLPVTIICDDIREPNNLGSLIRTAAAASVNQVILTKGCASPWESKALRGGAGGQFRVKVIGPMYWNQVQDILPSDLEVYIADSNEERGFLTTYSELRYNEDPETHKVLIVGGETHGVSDEARMFLKQQREADRKGSYIYIPLANGVESLNIVSAVSIILFEMKRQIEG